MARQNPRGTPKGIRDRQRAAEALRLRTHGYTYEEIKEELGYYDRTAARKAAMGLLRSIEVESVDELRGQAQLRLDAVVKEMMPIVQDQQRLTDERVKAANVIIRAQETQNRLQGLNKEPETPLQSTSVFLVPSDLIPDETAKALTEAGEIIEGEEA